MQTAMDTQLGYIDQQAEDIKQEIVKYSHTEYKVTTSDNHNSDKKLHRSFNQIANNLRRQGFSVTSVENWGRITWCIKL